MTLHPGFDRLSEKELLELILNKLNSMDAQMMKGFDRLQKKLEDLNKEQKP